MSVHPGGWEGGANGGWDGDGAGGDGDGAGKHHFEANLIDREAVNCFPILLSVAATAGAVDAVTLAVRDYYGISRLNILMFIRDSEPISRNERSL